MLWVLKKTLNKTVLLSTQNKGSTYFKPKWISYPYQGRANI